jgi:hypothetical protein
LIDLVDQVLLEIANFPVQSSFIHFLCATRLQLFQVHQRLVHSLVTFIRRRLCLFLWDNLADPCNMLRNRVLIGVLALCFHQSGLRIELPLITQVDHLEIGLRRVAMTLLVPDQVRILGLQLRLTAFMLAFALDLLSRWMPAALSTWLFVSIEHSDQHFVVL